MSRSRPLIRAVLVATLLLVAARLPAGAQNSLYATGSEVWVRFAGSDAGYTSYLYWSETPGDHTLFLFNNHSTAPGTEVLIPHTFHSGDEVLFSLYVTNTGDTFSTGPGTRNADGLAHFRVSSTLVDPRYDVQGGFEDVSGGGDGDYNDLIFDFGGVSSVPGPPTVTPEPASLALLGTGLAGLALIRRRRSARR